MPRTKHNYPAAMTCACLALATACSDRSSEPHGLSPPSDDPIESPTVLSDSADEVATRPPPSTEATFANDEEARDSIRSAIRAIQRAQSDGDRASAAAELSKAYAAFRALSDTVDDADELRQKMKLAWALGSLHMREAPARAVEIYRAGIEAGRTLTTRHETAEDLSALAGILHNVAMLTRAADQRVEPFEEAIGLQQRALDLAPDVQQYRKFLSNHYRALGQAFASLGRSNEIPDLMRRDLQLWSGNSMEVRRGEERIRQIIEELERTTDDTTAIQQLRDLLP